MYLLDTDICIYLIKGTYPALSENLKMHTPDQINISSITVAELSYGVAKSEQKVQNRNALIKFLSPFGILPFTEKEAEYYGRIRAQLEQGRRIIGPYDMQIAAQALAHSLTLITNNTREFSRVQGLKLENWVE